MTDVMVLKRQCERCPAVEEVPITPDDIKAGKLDKADGPPKVEIKLSGKVAATYRRLCDACTAAIQKDVDNIAKKREKKTTQRGG